MFLRYPYIVYATQLIQEFFKIVFNFTPRLFNIEDFLLLATTVCNVWYV